MVLYKSCIFVVYQLRDSKKTNIMNPDIIRIKPIKIYDKRNKELSNYNLVMLYDKECLITKERYDEIRDYNRKLRNEDLMFLKYLKNLEV